MTDLKLNDDGDLAIENFDLALVENSEQVRQQLQIRLRFFKGEWFLNTDFGVPYFQDIFKKPFDKPLVSSILKAQIMGIPGVIRLLAFNLNLDAAMRRLSLDVKVLTSDGELEYAGVI